MGRFEDRATKPSRGPKDLLRWRFGKGDPLHPDHDALDRVRPELVPGGAEALAQPDPCAVWIGHATWAVRLGGQLIVTDPVWSRSLSGVARRLVEPGVELDAMPSIDIVLVTHDHRDHMDLPTLAKLPHTALYLTGLGNGERLRKLGHERVVELDWWQTHDEAGVAITLVPARHWSMRMPWNRNDTLWGGFVIASRDGVVYHAGDTAWADHFGEIRARVPAIDWAMLPIGGYAPRWFMEPQHIGPEEAGQAFEALGAKHLLAMHWGTFRLTDEAVGEPVARLEAWWQERPYARDRLWIPRLGEPLRLVR
ncbi:MAG TPA: MBL fold metallo-hydrolase [Kofleriaceae bacterium]|nr:MBL fold metallo-hydrolase [Kofleriaceae bacterium]